MKKIGLAGFGFIGSYIYEHLKENHEITVAAVWEPIAEKTTALEPHMICSNLDDLGSRDLDLIIEAAHADVVIDLWPRITSGADFMISSMTSLSNAELYTQMEQTAKDRGQKIFLPHGAVLGLDGLRDGRAFIDSVEITTTKHPRNLGMSDANLEHSKVIFQGTTSEACKVFPRNVNVHAAIALAGIGFDATQSTVIADPETDKMHHRIEVKGRGLNWNLEIESFSAGAVTGSYTPESLYQSLLTILTGNSGFCIV